MLHFIDPTSKFIGLDGKPNRRLFKADRLHPNKIGYALLTSSIKPILEAEVSNVK
jgi:hypothetical protein